MKARNKDRGVSRIVPIRFDRNMEDDIQRFIVKIEKETGIELTNSAAVRLLITKGLNCMCKGF